MPRGLVREATKAGPAEWGGRDGPWEEELTSKQRSGLTDYRAGGLPQGEVSFLGVLLADKSRTTTWAS